MEGLTSWLRRAALFSWGELSLNWLEMWMWLKEDGDKKKT